MNSRIGQYLSSHPVLALIVLLFSTLAALPAGLFLTFALVTSVMCAVGFVFIEGMCSRLCSSLFYDAISDITAACCLSPRVPVVCWRLVFAVCALWHRSLLCLCLSYLQAVLYHHLQHHQIQLPKCGTGNVMFGLMFSMLMFLYE